VYQLMNELCNIQVVYVHKRLTVNGILKDCVKEKGLVTDGS